MSAMGDATPLSLANNLNSFETLDSDGEKHALHLGVESTLLTLGWKPLHMRVLIGCFIRGTCLASPASAVWPEHSEMMSVLQQLLW